MTDDYVRIPIRPETADRLYRFKAQKGRKETYSTVIDELITEADEK